VEHLHEVGKRIRLKENISRLHRILDQGIAGHRFEFFVVSAAPVEVIKSALEGIVPVDHIYGTQFRYHASGPIETIEQVTAGYGKVAVLDRIQNDLQLSSDRIVYVGDGSSDVHVMLHVNRRDGFTIAVSENKHLAPIAKRTVLSDNALGVLIPILETIVNWDRVQIRAFLEAQGFSIQEWDKVSTDETIRRKAWPAPCRGWRLPVCDAIGWLATAIFGFSYFVRNPATMRWVQASAAVCWMLYGFLLHAPPVIVANVIVASLAGYSAFRTAPQRSPESL
jgi:phosphoserine phosphatase